MTLSRRALLLAILAPLAPAQDAVVVKCGQLLTITKGTLAPAAILIEGGRIKQIAGEVAAEWSATVIDASDKVVMPAWVIAHTAGGMGSANERLPNVPYLTVADAIDPASDFFEEALRNGIGTLHVLPGNSTLIGGLGMVVRPIGHTVEDMAVRTRGGMKLSLEAGGQSRMAQIQKLRRALAEAQEWQQERDRVQGERAEEKAAGATDVPEDAEPDPKRKPLLDLLAGKHQAWLWVPSAAEVPEALRIGSAFAFETTLVLGPSCWKAAAQLAGVKRPVVLSEVAEYWETDPDTDEERLVCPAAELQRRGIPFALGIDQSGRGQSGPGRYPWWQIATAIRHGVDRKTAIEAMTIVPARLLGLEAEVGSIEEGKVANLQILTGDPLQATTWVDRVLLEGEVVYERAKDPRLLHLFGKTEAQAGGSAR